VDRRVIFLIVVGSIVFLAVSDLMKKLIQKVGWYSYQQLKDLWINAGGDPANADIAAAVAMAESSGNPNAFNSADPSGGSRGLWQINGVWGELSSFDPSINVRAAIQISANGANWKPWGAFTNGSYAKYLQA